MVCSCFVYSDRAGWRRLRAWPIRLLARGDRRRTTYADQETERTAALHQRAAEGAWRAALLRRDEGCARPQVEIRHPPAHHGAGGARLHPPPAQPRAGAGSAETAGILDALVRA